MHLTGKDIEGIVKYPFQGKDWFLLVGVQGALLFVVAMTIVGAPFLLGFVASHVRNGIDSSTTYPGFDQWGKYWERGCKALGTHLVLISPLLVGVLVLSVAFLLAITLGIGGDDSILVAGVMLAVLASIFFYVVAMFYSIFVGVLQYAYIPLSALDLPWSTHFKFKAYLWPYLKANAADILILFLLSYALGIVAYIGFLAFFVGIFFTVSIAVVITAYGTGVIYKHSPVKFN